MIVTIVKVKMHNKLYEENNSPADYIAMYLRSKRQKENWAFILKTISIVWALKILIDGHGLRHS